MTKQPKSKNTFWHRMNGHDYQPFFHEDKHGVFFACSVCGYLMPLRKTKTIEPKPFEDWKKLS